jgi:hypothetical protein
MELVAVLVFTVKVLMAVVAVNIFVYVIKTAGIYPQVEEVQVELLVELLIVTLHLLAVLEVHTEVFQVDQHIMQTMLLGGKAQSVLFGQELQEHSHLRV